MYEHNVELSVQQKFHTDSPKSIECISRVCYSRELGCEHYTLAESHVSTYDHMAALMITWQHFIHGIHVRAPTCNQHGRRQLHLIRAHKISPNT